MKKLFLFLFIVISFQSCEKYGNSARFVNTAFNKKILDGYFVKSIAFDKLGNAWIGTFKQGLIKYSSTGTVVYNSSNSVIPDSTVIQDIAVDSKNNVWIGCEGLIKYDGSGFTFYNTKNTPMPEDLVGSIAIDSKDNIWFTSCRFRQGGIVKYDGKSWTVYTPDNSALPANFVGSIAVDKYDNVWLALSEKVNNAYLAEISNNSWKIYTGNDLGFSPYYIGNIRINSKNEVCAAIDYSLSSLWINTGPQVFIFDGKTSTQIKNDSISHIKSITIDRADNIWCAAYGGYGVYNGFSWFIDNSSFKSNSVFAIEQAPDNKIWIGTGNGIYINE